MQDLAYCDNNRTPVVFRTSAGSLEVVSSASYRQRGISRFPRGESSYTPNDALSNHPYTSLYRMSLAFGSRRVRAICEALVGPCF